MNETQSPAALACPKCGGAMRTYERSGVLIDQCTECRGIYLDRGELDRIIDAESPAASPRDRPAAVDRDERRPADEARRYAGDGRSGEEEEEEDERRTGGDADARRRAISDSASRGSTSQPRKRGGLFGDVMDMFGGGE
jgi:Zn-finger nucleic acid-binding protein